MLTLSTCKSVGASRIAVSPVVLGWTLTYEYNLFNIFIIYR